MRLQLKKLKNYARQILMPGGHYNRYIILANPRTGTNLLRGLLNANPAVIAYGELFRFNHSIGWDYGGIPHKAKAELILINEDPIRFLEKKVFVKFPAKIRAVGFKIFYFHAQTGNWRPVWKYLQEHKDIKVIHVKRNNVLKTYLSHTRALGSDIWVNTSNKEEKQPPMFLEYGKCLHYFKQIKEYEKKFDDFFKHHYRLELIYENLAAEYESEMKQVSEFLEIPHQTAEPGTFVQARKSLGEAIANYRELKEKFRSTQWEQYFED